MREARAAAFQEQRKLSTFSRAAQAEHRLQPRESRPLEFCHNARGRVRREDFVVVLSQWLTERRLLFAGEWGLLETAFRPFDADYDGCLTAAELRAAFAHFNAHGAGGDRIRNDEIDELVDAAHADERGLIRIADLVDAMMGP